MKILQLHNKVPYPPKDGGSIGVWNFTLEFAKQGHEVTLFVMNTQKHYYNIKTIPIEFTKIIKIIAVDVKVPVTFIGALFNLFLSNKPYNAQRFMLNNYKQKLIEILVNNEFDVILLEGLYLCPYIEIIRKYSKAMIVFKAHNIEHEIWERFAKNESNFFKQNYLKILSERIKVMETQTINKYDVLNTLTSRDANMFNSLGNKKPFFVSPVGIDVSHLIPQREKIVYPTLFYIGALDWAPNQEGLVWFIRKVWSNLNQKYPDLKFEIAGRNAPEWFVKILNEPNIVYYGEITDAYKFINEHAIMLVPLLSGSGMRIKIVEGLALGKTIVTTSIGTEGIDTTHNINILIADTAEQFQKQIEKLLSDKPLFESLGTNAIKFVKKSFDIKNITKYLIEFWNKNLIKLN